MKDGSIYQSGWSGLTYTDIQGFNGKTIPSADQTPVANLIKSLEDYICRATGRQFLVVSGAEYYSETFTSGQKRYTLKGFPFTIKKIIVNSVTVYDSASPLTGQYILNTDFYIKHNKIIFPNGLGATGYYNDVEVQYQITQFWADDIKQAIVRIVSDIYLNKKNSGKSLSSYSFSGLSLDFKDNGLTQMFDDLISHYRVDIP